MSLLRVNARHVATRLVAAGTGVALVASGGLVLATSSGSGGEAAKPTASTKAKAQEA